MKYLLIQFFIIFLSISTLAQELVSDKAIQKLTLNDCYKLLLEHSELLQIKSEDIIQAQNQYQEAISAIYPQLHLLGSQRIRNSDRFGRISNNNSENISSNQSKHPIEATLSLKQPIFTGFRESYFAQAAKSEISALESEKIRSAELLYQDLAQIFFQTIFYAEDINILNDTAQTLNQRIQVLQNFIKLGKSRSSEVEAANADLAQAKALKAQVKGLYSASKEILEFLINQKIDQFELIAQEKSKPTLNFELSELINQAKERNDLKAANFRVESAKNQITYAQRESWPNLSLESNYYAYEDPESNRDWDLQFKFDLPIFDAGKINSKVEQEKAKARSAKLNAQKDLRTVEKEVRIAYSDLNAAKEEVASWQEVLTASQKSLAAQTKDYELGVVTNLEVLAAITKLQEAKRSLLEAKTKQEINYFKLLVASGSSEIPLSQEIINYNSLNKESK